MQEMPGAPAGAQEQPQEGGGEAIKGMVLAVDKGLGQLAQVIGQSSPQHGEALGQISEAFRGVIEDMMSGGGQPEAQAPVPAAAGAGDVRQAF